MFSTFLTKGPLPNRVKTLWGIVPRVHSLNKAHLTLNVFCVMLLSILLLSSPIFIVLPQFLFFFFYSNPYFYFILTQCYGDIVAIWILKIYCLFVICYVSTIPVCVIIFSVYSFSATKYSLVCDLKPFINWTAGLRILCQHQIFKVVMRRPTVTSIMQGSKLNNTLRQLLTQLFEIRLFSYSNV